MNFEKKSDRATAKEKEKKNKNKKKRLKFLKRFII